MIVKKVVSPAKINLTLEIIKKTSSGFHELRTIMVKLPKIKDELEFEIKPGARKIKISCDDPDIPLNEKNICYRAVSVFLDVLKKEIEISIKIKKRIPVGAGLGGGSSNAASTFLVLNEYFKKPFSKKELIVLAAKIGKDIPFFFSDKEGALVGGLGEKILEEFDFDRGFFLIVNPGVNISTSEAYSGLVERVWFIHNLSRENLSRKFLKILKSEGAFETCFYNDFEIYIENKYPVIKEIKQTLLVFGADGVLMSGSGSTVFGYFMDKKRMFKARKEIVNWQKDFLVISGR